MAGFAVRHEESASAVPSLALHVTLRVWVPPQQVALQALHAEVDQEFATQDHETIDCHDGHAGVAVWVQAVRFSSRAPVELADWGSLINPDAAPVHEGE